MQKIFVFYILTDHPANQQQKNKKQNNNNNKAKTKRKQQHTKPLEEVICYLNNKFSQHLKNNIQKRFLTDRWTEMRLTDRRTERQVDTQTNGSCQLVVLVNINLHTEFRYVQTYTSRALAPKSSFLTPKPSQSKTNHAHNTTQWNSSVPSCQILFRFD